MPRQPNETPETFDLRMRALKLTRKPRPNGLHGHKEAWLREFVALWDANANEAMLPPMSRTAFLELFATGHNRLSEYRAYLRVFDAAVAAGVSSWHLSRTSVKVLSRLDKLCGDPVALVDALMGKGAPAKQELEKRAAAQAQKSQKGMPSRPKVARRTTPLGKT